MIRAADQTLQEKRNHKIKLHQTVVSVWTYQLNVILFEYANNPNMQINWAPSYVKVMHNHFSIHPSSTRLCPVESGGWLEPIPAGIGREAE